MVSPQSPGGRALVRVFEEWVNGRGLRPEQTRQERVSGPPSSPSPTRRGGRAGVPCQRSGPSGQHPCEEARDPQPRSSSEEGLPERHPGTGGGHLVEFAGEWFSERPGRKQGTTGRAPPHPRSASRGGRTACLPHGVRGRHSGLGDADLASLVLGTRMWVGASAPSEPAGTRPRAGAARVVSVRKCPACPAAAAPHPSPSLPDSRSRNASLTASGRLRAESPLGCPRRPCPPACRCVGTAGARPGATGLVAPRASRHQSGSRRVWWGEGRGLEG